MTSMIEKVARAICAKEEPDGRGDWNDYVVHARAAIEALMEPTASMRAEGESAASIGLGQPADEEALPRVWKWMLAAALKEDT